MPSHLHALIQIGPGEEVALNNRAPEGNDYGRLFVLNKITSHSRLASREGIRQDRVFRLTMVK